MSAYMGAMQALIGELSSLGYSYLSTNSGIGFSETWWQHPSGASVNLDDSVSIESNRRRVDRAKSNIILHEFKAKVQAAADEVAKARRPDMKAVIGYYLGVARHDRSRLDWLVSYEFQGNSYGYSSGQELLPEAYAEIAEHFPKA